MAKQILGKVVPISKGTYNSSTQYLILDIVEYNGSSYIAKQNVQGQAPTNTTYWQLLASQGDKPVYKVDYLTDAEMEEIVNDIIEDSTNAFNQNVTAKTTAFNNNATDKTNDFDSNATSKTSDFDSNASDKTTEFNTNASDKQSDFNSNASSTKDDFDRNATAKTEAYDDNASSKLSAYNDNATSKVNAYNSNASDKTTAFNNNVTAKTEAFNDNYDSKVELFDEHSEELQEQLDRYKTLENALPHATGEGAIITLNDTAKSPLTMDLEPTELSQASTPSPSSPQDIHVISGDNNIIVRNKNLFDEVWENGGVNSSDGSNETNGDTTRIRTKNHILVNPSTTYVLSFDNTNVDSNGARVALYNKNKEFISTLWYQDSQSDKWLFTTTNETYYIRFTAKHTNNSNWDLNNIKFQLEDNTSTSYVPHQEQIAELNLGDLEYCKIGDYKDRFFKNIPEDADYDATRELGKWYLKKNIGKVVLDGTETISIINTGTANWYYQITLSQNLPTASQTNQLCNYYANVQIYNGNTAQGIMLLTNGDAIRIRYGEQDTITNYKTWLETHNVVLYFKKTTPTYTLLNDTLQSQLETIYNKLLSYQEQTNISQENNDLPFNIKAKAVKDLNSLIEI